MPWGWISEMWEAGDVYTSRGRIKWAKWIERVEVAPHQNGKSDMSDIDLVGHTETWCSPVNLASFLGCLKTTLWHLETVSLVYWSCWGCGNVRREILFSWFRSYALRDVGLWKILSVTGDVMKAIHCGSLCASLCLHAAGSSHRSDHMGMMWGSLSRKICRYASLDAWLHETPWGMLNTRKHPATSSHSCIAALVVCQGQEKTLMGTALCRTEGTEAIDIWCKHERYFLCNQWLMARSQSVKHWSFAWDHIYQNLCWNPKVMLVSRIGSAPWLNKIFPKLPGLGSIFGNPSQGLAGVGPTEATTTWHVVGMIYVLDGSSMIFHDLPVEKIQSFSRWLSLLHLHLHQRLLLRRPFLLKFMLLFCFHTETGRFTQRSGTCSPLLHLQNW